MATEANWRRSILPFTLDREGGLSLDPKDPGNWTGGKPGKNLLRGTKFGIAASSHPKLDIRNLTLEQACGIYWAEYVRAPRFDRLDLPLLMVVFDAGVNCGPERAAAWLKAAEAKPSLKRQIAAFSAANLAYHRKLKNWPRYGNGWAARIAACEKRALLLVAAAPVPLLAEHPLPAAHIPRTLPKAAAQPPAGFWSQLLRVALDALFSPLPRKGVHP